FSSRRRHTRFSRDWSSDVCSSDLKNRAGIDISTCFRLADDLRGSGPIGPGIGYIQTVGGCIAKIRYVVSCKKLVIILPVEGDIRSEERRVGKEGRSRWWPDH